jgi:ketosteroid isomerase-like protein
MTTAIEKIRTADVQEIKTLNSSYNYAIDEADGKAWVACFTRNGVFNGIVEGERPRGAEELATFFKTSQDVFGEMHHLTTNEIITFDGDTARQKAYLQFFSKKNGKVEGSICVYQDWLELEDGTWKYSRRDVEFKVKFSEYSETP